MTHHEITDTEDAPRSPAMDTLIEQNGPEIPPVQAALASRTIFLFQSPSAAALCLAMQMKILHSFYRMTGRFILDCR